MQCIFSPLEMNEKINTMLESLTRERNNVCDPSEFANAVEEISRDYKSEVVRIEQEISEAIKEIYKKYEHN